MLGRQNQRNSTSVLDAAPERAAAQAAEHFLRRPAVDQLLIDAFDKPLTTVTAGAGFGKTQAVLSALRSTECNTAWMQLSELDNHVSRFWERLAQALDPQEEQLYDKLISLGYPESYAAFDQFLKLLSQKHEQTTVLVFDDFHLIRNMVILDFIELFISAQVSGFSIVLVSRKRPEISLSGMLSKGLLARVSEDDLRFSKEELASYLHLQGIQLSQEVLADLYAYSNGWIFGIYLAGLAAKKGNHQGFNPLLAAKEDIFDLIEKELFQKASDALQILLIKLSLLDVIPAELLRELAGHEQSLITEMTQLSMFIRHDPFQDSYRIHQLFEEFLQAKKAWLHTDEISQVHTTAAQWYLEHEHTFAAIYHYKADGRYREIFDIIKAIRGRVSGEAANSLLELIEQAPKDLLKAAPLVRVMQAAFLFNNNRLAEAKVVLLALQEEYEELPPTEENRTVLGEVYCLLAMFCIIENDYAFEELYRKADELLPHGSSLVDNRTCIAEGHNVCSISNPAAGELQRYQDALFRAAPAMARSMNGCGFGLEYLNAAESSLYTGNLKAAEQFAYEAISRAGQYRQYDTAYMAQFVLVRIYTARGNYAKAIEILDQLKSQLEVIHVAECCSLYDVISGWFYTKLGETKQVAEWIRHEEEIHKTRAPVLIGREYLVCTDSLLAEERYFELLAFIERTDSKFEERGILFALIQNRIIGAVTHHYLGNHELSIRFLAEAYELSYPNGLIMQFVEYGNRMRTLIHAARLNEDCTIPREWLDLIYTKSSSYAKMTAQLTAEHASLNGLCTGGAGALGRTKLSKRELELLTHLCRGMTRKEIASHCYLSLSTVNSVLKSAYNKLGAFNAADAARLAREQNLIPAG
ncbi:MAG: LuxR C-terminal-related transcriptional regulator [Coriobacteriia bacterium]|nr:LuxR C-terminal-related transcriptional regulator [Coriobacteriia bacterium]